ncbi:hypothetical protein AB4K20DRAFT_1806234 [Rhizopus microsporus]|uniref:Uncharacterized protein n=1 Tax=Rhizopus microsporus TaxID=58291 RepID=A0A1X0SFR1_RHIZD|nr:hypothetical protein BCV71DRAFT_230801 [Rhizopus microsporus]
MKDALFKTMANLRRQKQQNSCYWIYQTKSHYASVILWATLKSSSTLIVSILFVKLFIFTITSCFAVNSYGHSNIQVNMSNTMSSRYLEFSEKTGASESIGKLLSYFEHQNNEYGHIISSF